MEPPVCRTCGQKHWSRLCDEAPTRRVGPTPVGPTIDEVPTPKTKTIAVACSQCQLYEAEIKRLKKALAERTGCPVCAARKAAKAASQKRRRAKHAA